MDDKSLEMLKACLAQLAVANAVMSGLLAVLALVLMRRARPHVGRLPFLDNYYWSICFSFTTLAIAYIFRLLIYLNLLDPILAPIALIETSLTNGFDLAAAIQLNRHLGPPVDRSRRLYRLIPYELVPYAACLAEATVEIYLTFGGRLGWLSPAAATIPVAFLSLGALLALAYPLRHCHEVSGMKRLVRSGLVIYAFAQFLGIPGHVYKIGPDHPWAEHFPWLGFLGGLLQIHALRYDFVAILLAILGKLVIAFGLLLVNHELQVRWEKSLLKDNLMMLGALTGAILHQGRDSVIHFHMKRLRQDLEEGDTSQAEIRINRVTESLDSMFGLINRLDTWRGGLQKAVDLSAAIEKGYQQVQDGLKQGINFAPDVPAPLMVRGDADLLAEVFRTLFKNALEAMSNRGKLEVQHDGKHKGWVIIRVRDSGCGISQEARADLFRLKEGSSKPAGRGMGLWLARSYIVGLLGGRLELQESTEGAGSTFILGLPSGVPPAKP